jgi:MerR family transcriptional regulator/heat shock protein HspR
MDTADATGKPQSSVTLDRPVYHISAVAALAAVHPQTLRLYERQGLLKPSRSRGNTRLYSERDVERLRLIVHLTRDEGVNLAGVSKILELQETIQGVEAAIQGWMEGWHERMRRELSARHEPLRPAHDDRDAAVKIAVRRG